MIHSGHVPDQITYITLLSSLGNSKDYTAGHQIYEHLMHSKLDMTLALHTAIILFFAKCGHLSKAISLFDNLCKSYTPDLPLWTGIIAACVDQNLPEKGLELYKVITVFFHLTELRQCSSVG
jgi:pentatricopeptide repeat protein